MKRIPKSHFKPRAFEVLRAVAEQRSSIIITDHGVDSVRIEPCEPFVDSAGVLEGTIIRWDRPDEPVAVEDWEATR